MKGITTLEILIVIAIITAYIGIAYVGLHFITKFW